VVLESDRALPVPFLMSYISKLIYCEDYHKIELSREGRSKKKFHATVT